MSRPFDIDFVIRLHESPAFVGRVTSAWHSDSGEGKNYIVGIEKFQCEAIALECGTVVRVRVDPGDAPHSGLQHLRTKVRVIDPGGNEMLPVLRVPVWVDNGKPRDDYRSAYVQGIGWYEGSGYAGVQFRSEYPYEPISGVWEVEIRWPAFASFDGDSNNSTHNFVSIDPNFHSSPIDFGMVVLDRDNPTLNTTSCVPLGRQNCGSPMVTLSIDTNRLSNGPHKLVIRNDAADDRGSTNSGVLVIPFTVSN